MDLQITKAKRVVQGLMSDRGFFPSSGLEDPAESSSKEPVIWEFEKDGQLALVFWGLTIESKVAFSQRVFAEANTRDPKQIVLIVDKALVSKAKTTISNMKKTRNINVFELGDVQFPKPKHRDVPPHRLLTPEQKEKVLEEYQVTERECPRISDIDPIVQWYGWEVGDMIEIERKEGIFRKDKTYRIVWGHETLGE